MTKHVVVLTSLWTWSNGHGQRILRRQLIKHVDLRPFKTNVSTITNWSRGPTESNRFCLKTCYVISPWIKGNVTGMYIYMNLFS